MSHRKTKNYPTFSYSSKADIRSWQHVTPPLLGGGVFQGWKLLLFFYPLAPARWAVACSWNPR